MLLDKLNIILNSSDEFYINYLYIPTLNDKYNDYLLRHILDFILMY